MANIPASELAQQILQACLTERAWPTRILDALIERALDETDPFAAAAATRAFFGIVVERLADLFEPDLCDVYARLFAHVISRALPEHRAADLLVRYRRIRHVRRFPGGQVNRVFVLSRVTLGADIAVTSVALQAAKTRFPEAEICFVGPSKNAELFAADPRITAVPVAYGRSSLLRDRLLAAAELQVTVDEIGSIVIDPDSRLTQLGLIPVCDDARYFFFESRSYGGESLTPLPRLTAEWLNEVFDVKDARPYAAPVQQVNTADVTVSWGVGENEEKRAGDDFEYRVMSALLERGWRVLMDRGAGGEEACRADALVERLQSPAQLAVHDGSYASFASHILQSRLYIGYDSAGQHVAAAGGVPLISVFKGFPCQRMFARWHPYSPSAHVIPVHSGVDSGNASAALPKALEAIAEVAEEAPAGSTD